MLVINNLNSSYGKISVLDNINLYINQGEVVTILGANGAGKSTLLMSIMNETSSNLKASGEVIFKNQNLLDLPTHEIAKLGIALVPEGRRVFPQMTVNENLQLGSTCAAKPWDYSYLDYVYELFPILKTRGQMYAGNLSGGEQQMLAIGRALMSKPTLLLLDEPSLGLAPKIVSQIFEILKSISNEHTAILIIEQNIRHAIKLAHRYYVLTNGCIVKQGTQEEFYNIPDVEKYYLG